MTTVGYARVSSTGQDLAVQLEKLEKAGWVPECTLDQGPGKMSIARIVAREWQTDGYLKPGKIKSVRRLTTEEFMSGVMGWR